MALMRAFNYGSEHLPASHRASADVIPCACAWCVCRGMEYNTDRRTHSHHSRDFRASGNNIQYKAVPGLLLTIRGTMPRWPDGH